MTVAFDASSSSSAGNSTLTWDHDPVGTPRCVIVFVVEDTTTTDGVTGVTYAGTSMTDVSGSPNIHTTGETGAVHCFFLGASVPTGDPAEIVVSITGSVGRIGFAITLTAAGDTEVVDSDGTIASDSLVDPSVTLSLASRTSFAAIGFYSGHAGVASVTPLSNWNSRVEHDFGGQVAAMYSYDTIGSSDVTAGWTQTAQDATMIALAVSETVAGHPFSNGTRLGQQAIGVRPYLGFVAKTEFISPRLNITRLGQQAIGVRPYAGFVAKTEATAAGGKFLPLMGVG